MATVDIGELSRYLHHDDYRELQKLPKKQHPEGSTLYTQNNSDKPFYTYSPYNYSYKYYTIPEVIDLVWEEGAISERTFRNMLAKTVPVLFTSDAYTALKSLGLAVPELRKMGSVFDIDRNGDRVLISYFPNPVLAGLLDYYTYREQKKRPVVQKPKIKGERTTPAGRFLKTIFPDMSDVEIQEKVEKIKAILLENEITITEHDGTECAWTWNEKNYHPTCDIGSMDGSCMSGDDVISNFTFFETYKDKFGIVRATRKYNDKDYVVGRVLLYKADDGRVIHEYIMGSDAAVNLLQDYVDSKGYTSVSSEHTDWKITIPEWPTEHPLPAMDSVAVMEDEKCIRYRTDYRHSYSSFNRKHFGRDR